MWMDAALIVSRLLLAAVFGVAAIAKLADRAHSEKSAIDFGLPRAVARPVSIFLPLIELATATLLIPVAWAWWGAVLALALLLAFTVAIGLNLARGRRPDCHCFGQLHSEPTSWRTVVRNAALAAIAGLLVWQGDHYPGPSAVAWFVGLSTTQAIVVIVGLTTAAAMAAQGWLLVQLLRQHGRLLLRMDALESRTAGVSTMSPGRHPPLASAGLAVGDVAPGFALPDLNGKVTSIDEMLEVASSPVLLVFVDPGCGPCIALAPELALMQRDYASTLSIVLISRATPNENRAKHAAFGNVLVLLEAERRVADAYQAYGTPAAVVVGQDGRIASPLAMGAEQIRSLIFQALLPRGRPTGRDVDPVRQGFPFGRLAQ
ncbi:MauE/DoxX family redox-associated membrane protein [Bradyrhizobium japonicum]|uniref:MauE/DoxX family redox-associated membrane protein n=1 Tax=Bradyrhizobium japonicum TaxID=375 RepID=UPI001269A0C6|nr:MauE/DoxX family redox-associated membrane protein [Bradyrhizobium japonicum]